MQCGRIFCLVNLFIFSTSLTAQSVKQEKMDQLKFLVGEWIGTSTIYENGEISKQVSAFEKVSYDLDKSILVVELNTELLQLHTIIFYDEKDSMYYYFPFSKRGVRRLPAEFRDGKLIVNSAKDNRFIFESPSKNTFREYGERLIDGEWVKYFEDQFENTQ